MDEPQYFKYYEQVSGPHNDGRHYWYVTFIYQDVNYQQSGSAEGGAACFDAIKKYRESVVNAE